MKISNVYTQEKKNNQYIYRFEFRHITHTGHSSFMLYHDPYKIVSSILSHLYEYTSLREIKPYENIRG